MKNILKYFYMFILKIFHFWNFWKVLWQKKRYYYFIIARSFHRKNKMAWTASHFSLKNQYFSSIFLVPCNYNTFCCTWKFHLYIVCEKMETPPDKNAVSAVELWILLSNTQATNFSCVILIKNYIKIQVSPRFTNKRKSIGRNKGERLIDKP